MSTTKTPETTPGPYRYKLLVPTPLNIIEGPDGKSYGDVVREMEGVLNHLASRGWELQGSSHFTAVTRKDLAELFEVDFDHPVSCLFFILRRPWSATESGESSE